MNIRPAKVPDAQGICDLVNYYAEQDLMLHRSLEDIYDCLREFIVAEENGDILGCVAVDVYWGALAEIRSLAVAKAVKGTGVGAELLAAAIEDARRLGIVKLFALTYEQEYFMGRGFSVVDLNTLPEKVWRECLEWYNQGHRHETAMVLVLEETPSESAQ